MANTGGQVGGDCAVEVHPVIPGAVTALSQLKECTPELVFCPEDNRLNRRHFTEAHGPVCAGFGGRIQFARRAGVAGEAVGTGILEAGGFHALSASPSLGKGFMHYSWHGLVSPGGFRPSDRALLGSAVSWLQGGGGEGYPRGWGRHALLEPGGAFLEAGVVEAGSSYRFRPFLQGLGIPLIFGGVHGGGRVAGGDGQWVRRGVYPLRAPSRRDWGKVNRNGAAPFFGGSHEVIVSALRRGRIRGRRAALLFSLAS